MLIISIFHFFISLLPREGKDKPIIHAMYQNNREWKHQAANGARRSQKSPLSGLRIS
jgi:hypothetical protein